MRDGVDCCGGIARATALPVSTSSPGCCRWSTSSRGATPARHHTTTSSKRACSGSPRHSSASTSHRAPRSRRMRCRRCSARCAAIYATTPGRCAYPAGSRRTCCASTAPSASSRRLSAGPPRPRRAPRAAGPTPQQVAERVGLELEQVVEALMAGRAYRATSMEERVGGETEDLTLADTFGGDDPELGRRELLVSLRQARHVLTDRERYVMHLRFAEDRTQSEIAERIGVSQMQVSRILRGLLGKLRLELRRQPAAARHPPPRGAAPRR